MFWVYKQKKNSSFEHPKHMFKLVDKKRSTIYTQNFRLSGPIIHLNSLKCMPHIGVAPITHLHTCIIKNRNIQRGYSDYPCFSI